MLTQSAGELEMRKYLIRYYDATTGAFLMQRVQRYPEQRDRVPGVPVLLRCYDLSLETPPELEPLC